MCDASFKAKRGGGVIELVPVFQPIVDIAGGIRTIGYEALIRGDTLSGRCGAKEVFQRSNEFGGMLHLGERIQELELRSGIPLLAGKQRLFLNVPVGAYQESSWRVTQTDARNVVLEVSERNRLNDEEMAWLTKFRSDGVQIAIDDFGVGQTNLRMLSALCPDYIKLDLSFVRRKDFDTIRRVRRFAEDWGASLIVEGVETAMEARAVMDAGVRYIQGFFYGKPNEADYWKVFGQNQHAVPGR